MVKSRVYRPPKAKGSAAKKAAVRHSAFKRILGQDMRPDELTGFVRQGFPITVVERLREELDAPQAKVLKLTRISPATLSRRRAITKSTQKRAKRHVAALALEMERELTEGTITVRLKPDESDRVYRIASVMEAAEQLFEGDHGAALRWLKEPAKALGGIPPLDYLDTEVGADTVRDLIGRLEHGVVI